MNHTLILLCASILLIMHALLSLNVSSKRIDIRNNGDSDQRANALGIAVRAHGNASEYNAIFIAVYLYFSLSVVSVLTVVLCVSCTLFRIFHAVGLLNVQKVGDRHPLRLIGSIGTYTSMVVLAVVILF